MKRRVLCLASAVLLALPLLVGYARPAAAQLLRPSTSPSPPADFVQAVPQSPVPRGPGIDDLLAKLATIKAKKAELDKEEKETVAQLKQKLGQLKQRLQKLGVEGDEPGHGPTPLPPPVSPGPVSSTY